MALPLFEMIMFPAYGIISGNIALRDGTADETSEYAAGARHQEGVVIIKLSIAIGPIVLRGQLTIALVAFAASTGYV